jgi:tRNA pseudouridine38-40 synthase
LAAVSGTPVTALTIAYDGAPFAGFARQPGRPTVQGRLEDALRVALRREVAIVGAGRTDAGVHARAQVVSFISAPGDEARDDLRKSVNALAGPDIAVSEVRSAVPGFSARYDAVMREYRYLVVPGPVPPVALSGRAWWSKRSLDLDAMREGASNLIGEHDFRSFCVTGSAEGKRTLREIVVLEIGETCELGERCVVIRVAGRSFLHSMVRIMVGSLVEVGRGRRDPAWVADAVAAGKRGAAGQTAPPHGLTLWSISYPEEYWLQP